MQDQDLVPREKMNIMLVEDGMRKTLVPYSRNFLQAWTTFRTETFGECHRYYC